MSSADELITLDRLEEACLSLRHALPHALQVDDVAQLIEFVRRLPASTKKLTNWVELQVRLLGAANEPKQLLALLGDLEPHHRVRFTAYVAWANVRLGHDEEVLRLTAHIGESSLEPGLSWRSRGEALARLEHPDWRDAFAHARTHLHGVPLGLCLREEGVLCASKGDSIAALQLFAQSFACLRKHPFEAVWTKYNQGVVSLNAGLPEAEAHFLEMLELMRSKPAKRFEARAWCGLGASRRSLGEFERAISAYRRACRVAERSADPDDLCQAWFGIGHTRRVQQTPVAALEAFYTAAQFDPRALNGSSFVHASIALVQAQLGDLSAAQRSLELFDGVLGVSREHRERRAVVQAELHRARGEVSEAVAVLARLTFESLWMREERLCFPQLFALLEAVGGRGPAILPSATGLVVEVRASGFLCVLVNGRRVALAPTGMAGQVLVLLLESGGAASVAALVAALFPEATGSMERAKAQQISKHIKDLRRALGWDDSVIALGGGAYRLDERATWRYDVATARSHHAPVQRFLEGVYAEWAVELGRSLSSSDRPVH